MKQPDLLISGLKDGDYHCFTKIYDNYNYAVNGVIYGIVGDKDIAEELVQDTFVKVWQKREDYDSTKGRFFTWIISIARNLAIDMYRSKRYKNERKNLDTQDFVSIVQGSDSLNQQINSIGLSSFIEKLKPICISIIDLLFFKGYTHKDAAETLEIPLGTLKTRNRNCIENLKTIVKD